MTEPYEGDMKDYEEDRRLYDVAEVARKQELLEDAQDAIARLRAQLAEQQEALDTHGTADACLEAEKTVERLRKKADRQTARNKELERALKSRDGAALRREARLRAALEGARSTFHQIQDQTTDKMMVSVAGKAADKIGKALSDGQGGTGTESEGNHIAPTSRQASNRTGDAPPPKSEPEPYTGPDLKPRTVRNELKTWPKFFNEIITEEKRFEVRSVKDRVFVKGDLIRLKEWDPDTEEYTGRWAVVEVTYIMQGEFRITANVCVMSINLLEWDEW